MMKSTGTNGAGTGLWQGPNTGATNESGFGGLPGGLLDDSGADFYFQGYGGFFWTSSEIDATFALVRRLMFIDSDITMIDYPKARGVSVRCVRGFDCGDVITDPRDWQAYQTVEIGTQCWMAENLNIGVRIDSTTDQTDNDIIEKHCYRDLESNCDVYGGLYVWDEMMGYSTQAGIQGICPDAWHIPTFAEWTVLTDYLGGATVAGGKMKSTGTIEEGTGLWHDPNEGASNLSGFTGLPGGFHHSFQYYFSGIGNTGYFLSSSLRDGSTIWGRHLEHYSGEAYTSWYGRTHGFSVRCIHD
jgi:uncharacterized protein (TIGR02145 family)